MTKLTSEHEVIIFIQKVESVMTNMECFEKLTIPYQVGFFFLKKIRNYTDEENVTFDVLQNLFLNFHFNQFILIFLQS